MKLFSASQIKNWEARTISQLNSDTELMERAAKACVESLKNVYDRSESFLVFCGMGSNGGDGLCITRFFAEAGYQSRAIIVKHRDKYSEATLHQLEKLKKYNADLVTEIEEGFSIKNFSSSIVVIDAILGTGTNRPLDGLLADVVHYVNDLNNLKISIELPTGLAVDDVPAPDHTILNADATLTFQQMKRCMLHEEARAFCGVVEVLDIGLDAQFVHSTSTPYSMVSHAMMKSIYRPRSEFGHKGTFGTAHIIAGSDGMAGAATLACTAALRSGAGKVIAHVPKSNVLPLQINIGEAICKVCGENEISPLPEAKNLKHVLVGPGIGIGVGARRAMRTLIEDITAPLVIDADGINLLAQDLDLLDKIPEGSILTPHVAEFERLFGQAHNSLHRVDMARREAMKYNLHIVLKGHFTSIIQPDGSCFYNTTGNSGMATAGSGDVLAGIIVGLLARGYSSTHAALLGVYFHGLSGDFAALKLSQEAVMARDINDHLGKAFLTLGKS